jgi:hypothetical protein
MTYRIEYSLEHEDFTMSDLTSDQVKAVTRSIEENGGEVHDVRAERGAQ